MNGTLRLKGDLQDQNAERSNKARHRKSHGGSGSAIRAGGNGPKRALVQSLKNAPMEQLFALEDRGMI